MIYINNLTELPTNCKTCIFRGTTNLVCSLVEWNCNISIYLQNINISEKEWHEENWKHPDCPLKHAKNKYNIHDIVKIKDEYDTYKIYAIEYYHNKGIIYELWRIGDLLEKEVEESLLEKI